MLLVKHGGDPDTLIRHELGLYGGKRRIDVAVVNEEFTGYEIKSDEDTLIRLRGQVEDYSRVFDRAILVTTKRHFDDALAMLPNWWGIILASFENGIILLENVYKPGLNEQYDAFSLAQLLWREEALKKLRLYNKGQGLSKKARYYVWKALAAAVSLNDLRSIVRASLKARREWPGGQLCTPYGEAFRKDYV